MDLTAVALGLIAGALGLGWALDVGGWTTWLKGFHRSLGSWLWSFGDEVDYVRFMRRGAWFVVAVSVVVVVLGALGR